MENDILCSIIEAGGAIIAAVIAAYIAAGRVENTAKNVIGKYFYKYSENRKKAKEVMDSAKKSITIIVNCGNVFLEQYADDLANYMKKGIKIKFLLLDDDNFRVMEKYTMGEKAEDSVLEYSKRILRELSKKYGRKMEIKVFKNFLTASYICADLEKGKHTERWLSSSIVHVMYYQFRTDPKDSPIKVFEANDGDFEIVADAAKKIWDEGKTINMI